MPFLIIFLVLLVIFLLSFYLKLPSTRGKHGENQVKWEIGETGKHNVASIFDKEEDIQYTINNLTLKNNNGTTCQIDHIVINGRGIFVIETKNYSGKIYGNHSSHEWTQVLAYGRRKYKLYNPLKQNATHVYNVKKIVGNLPVFSLIVFTQNNTKHIKASNVIPLSELKRTLKKGPNIITKQQMESAYKTLLSNNKNISTKEHVNNIQERQYNVNHGICPNCKGKLVLRNGIYGEFWGCSNYPNCKFIKKK